MTNDDVDIFVEQQKAIIAKEKKKFNKQISVPKEKKIENNLFKQKDDELVYKNASSKAFVDTNPVQAIKRPSTPKLLKLGEDYKNFRNDLNRERHKDYINSLKNNKVMGSLHKSILATQTSDHGMSLPIRDHKSAQEKLRKERNREYKEYLMKETEKNTEKPYYEFHKSENRLKLNNISKEASTNVLHPENSLNIKEPALKNDVFNINEQEKEIMQNQLEGDDNHLLPPDIADKSYTAQTNTNNFNNFDEYVLLKQRELDVYASKLQGKIEADGYALRTRQEADDYARKKKNMIDQTYEELLEKKRREEHKYRSSENSFYPRARVKKGDESYYPALRIVPRVRYKDYIDDDYSEISDDELYQKSKRDRRRNYRKMDDDSSINTNNVVRRKESGEGPYSNIQSLEDNTSDNRKASSANIRNRNQQKLTIFNANTYDTPGEVRSKSAPPDKDANFTGLPIGERENIKSAKEEKQKYRKELQDQIAKNLIKKERDKSQERTLMTEKRLNEKSKPKKVSYADEKDQRKVQAKVQPVNGLNTFPSKPMLDQRNIPYSNRSIVHSSTYQLPPKEIITPEDQAYFYYANKNPLDPTFNESLQNAILTRVPLVNNRTFIDQENSVLPETVIPASSTNKKDGLFSFHDTKSPSKQQKALTYQEELKKQMEEKKRAKELKEQEEERYNRKIELEMREYNPWGKGGGGAPMKDEGGKTISDLRQMRQINDEVSNNPEKLRQKVLSTRSPQPPDRIQHQASFISPMDDAIDTLQATPRNFGRSNPFESKQSHSQKSQKDVYKEELQKQIDEKKRVEAEKREKLRIEEEKEERRLEEQNRKMQEEFEAEKQKKQEKIDQQRRKNEELHLQSEEKKRVEKEHKNESEMIREQENKSKKQNKLHESPQQTARLKKLQPVIADGEKIPRTPVVPFRKTLPTSTNKSDDVQLSNYNNFTAKKDTPFENNSNKVSAVNNNHRTFKNTSNNQSIDKKESAPRYLYSRDSTRISRELSALRKHLAEEQKRIENQLRTEDSDLTLNSQIVDLSNLKQKPVQVQRLPKPPVFFNKIQGNTLADETALQEFNNYKYKNGEEKEAIKILKTKFPEQPVDAETLERQQQELIANQIRNLENIRNPIQTSLRTRRNSRNPNKEAAFLAEPPKTANSLLETETTYIPISDDLPLTPKKLVRTTSSRRQRLLTKPSTPDLLSLSDLKLLSEKNKNRLHNLDFSTKDSISVNDADEILSQFVSKKSPKSRKNSNASNIIFLNNDVEDTLTKNKRSPSLTTLESEPWLRPSSVV